MDDDDTTPLEVGLNALVDEGAIAREHRNALEDLTNAAAEKKAAVSANVDALTEELVAERITYDAFIDELRRVGSYDASLAISVPSSSFDALANAGVVETGPKGPRFAEPFWLYMYRLLDSPAASFRGRSPIVSDESGVLSTVGRAVRWLARKIGTHKALDNRYWLAHSVTARVGQEPSMLRRPLHGGDG